MRHFAGISVSALQPAHGFGRGQKGVLTAGYCAYNGGARPPRQRTTTDISGHYRMGDSSARQLATQRLDSWKEIAAFFSRDGRTVRRWEKERALPVHRVPGGGRGGVYAYSQ